MLTHGLTASSEMSNYQSSILTRSPWDIPRANLGESNREMGKFDHNVTPHPITKDAIKERWTVEEDEGAQDETSQGEWGAGGGRGET